MQYQYEYFGVLLCNVSTSFTCFQIYFPYSGGRKVIIYWVCGYMYSVIFLLTEIIFSVYVNMQDVGRSGSLCALYIKAGFHFGEFGHTTKRWAIWACAAPNPSRRRAFTRERAVSSGSWIKFNFFATRMSENQSDCFFSMLEHVTVPVHATKFAEVETGL